MKRLILTTLFSSIFSLSVSALESTIEMEFTSSSKVEDFCSTINSVDDIPADNVKELIKHVDNWFEERNYGLAEISVVGCEVTKELDPNRGTIEEVWDYLTLERSTVEVTFEFLPNIDTSCSEKEEVEVLDIAFRSNHFYAKPEELKLLEDFQFNVTYAMVRTPGIRDYEMNIPKCLVTK